MEQTRDKEEKNNKEKGEELEKDIINLVIERLKTIPATASLSIGERGSFSVKEMIDHVRENDDTGKQIIETQLEYIRSLKDLPVTPEEYEPSNY